MSMLRWRDNFKVGITELDHEHRELLSLIDELLEQAKETPDIDHVLEALGEIFAAISAHFALEEKMMRDTHYLAYGDHKEDHQTLLDDLQDIIDDAEDDGTFDETQLNIDLNRWFSDHFKTHDAKLHRSQPHH
jgi:hemerythrin